MQNKNIHLAKRPDNLFILTSLLILGMSLVFWGESVVIDMLGFTVFIDGKSTIYLLGFLMIFYWIIYRFSTRHLLSNRLTWIHIIITIGVVAYFLATETWYLKSNASNDFEANLIGQLMINKERTIRVASVMGAIFIIGQLTLMYNLLIGLRKERK